MHSGNTNQTTSARNQVQDVGIAPVIRQPLATKLSRVKEQSSAQTEARMCLELTREEGRCSKPVGRLVPCFLVGAKGGLLASLPAGITDSPIASASVARVLASAGEAVLLATRLLLLVTGLLCTGDQSLPLDMSTGRDTAVEMGQLLSPCLLPRAFLAGSFAEVLGRMTQRL